MKLTCIESLPDGWRKPKNQSLSNLYVFRYFGNDVGMINKPRDTRGDRNAWRAFKGIGFNQSFLGHRWNKHSAMALVAASVGVLG